MKRVFNPVVGVVLAGLMASACVNVLPEQPKPDAVYRFSAPVELNSLAASLVIREPDAPRLMAGRQLVAEGPNGGLRVVRGVEWVDRVTRLFQVSLTDSFGSDGGGYAVDDTAGISSDYELYWRVADFALKGDTAVCSLRITLMEGAARMPVAQWTSSVTSDPIASRAPGVRSRALAATGEACVRQAAREISAEVEAAEAANERD